MRNLANLEKYRWRPNAEGVEIPTPPMLFV